jgi:hypothetical protein
LPLAGDQSEESELLHGDTAGRAIAGRYLLPFAARIQRVMVTVFSWRKRKPPPLNSLHIIPKKRRRKRAF